MKKIRNLKADEIECRPQSVKNGKATILLYIDSRAATDLLDECYGMENWTMEYKDVAGQIYGRLTIYDNESDRWVFREDTGSPANIEKEKSLASDILKRCIVRFGVTELYTAPRIVWDDDGYGNTGYRVSDVQYNNRRQMTYLRIVNRFGKEAFIWNKDNGNDTKETVQVSEDAIKASESKKETTVAVDKVTEYKTALTTQCTALKNTGVDKDEILKFFNYYTKAIEQGWKGKEFRPENLWVKWNTPRDKRVS